MTLIALEEHYVDENLLCYLGAPSNALTERMRLGHSSRLEDMDAAGISMQVLSHAPPGLQAVPDQDAVALCRDVNDRLHGFIADNSARFAAFSSLPTTHPRAAAEELERTVTKLGFKGAMINGSTNGEYLDDRKYWPILEAAEALNVPIYLHPADLPSDAKRALIGDYARTHPMFAAAAWGFTVDAGTHALRLALSGAFDRFPRLRIILGHLGEGLPFLLDRIDESLARNTPMKNFASVFRTHFYITTSGFFSDHALACSIAQLGEDKILFSVDWPYADNHAAAAWIRKAPLNSETRKLIAGDTARTLLTF